MEEGGPFCRRKWACVQMVHMCQPHYPGKSQCLFLWDVAERNVDTGVTALVILEKELLRIPVRPIVVSEQQSLSVFVVCEITESRTVMLVLGVPVP